MNIDTGLGVVIVAVLIFYLLLIILQRERAKQVRRAAEANVSNRKMKKGKQQAPAVAPRYSILSPNRRDRAIGGIGVCLILVGVLLYAKILPAPILQTYWWIPTAVGIVAFSWLFRL